MVNVKCFPVDKKKREIHSTLFFVKKMLMETVHK